MRHGSKLLLWSIAAAMLIEVFLVATWSESKPASTGASRLGPPPASPNVGPAPIVDPETPLNQMALRLAPLTQEELAAEAKAWVVIAKRAIEEWTEAKIQVNLASGAEAKAVEQKLTDARSRRTAVFDRFSAVLTAWEEKGGDAKMIDEDRQYMASVIRQGIKTTHLTTAWMFLMDWLVAPNGGIRLGIRIGVMVGLLLLFVFIAKMVSSAVARTVDRSAGFSSLLKSFLKRVVYWLTIAIGIAIGLSALGVNISPLLALIGGGSFILAFALQNTLSNFASGLMIMIYKPFDVGHFVTLAGISGTVKQLGLVSTTLRSPDNQELVIPNNNVWNSNIVNFSSSGTRRVDLSFGIAYDADADAAQHVLEEIIATHPLVLADPEPVVRMHQLADSCVAFVCRPWTSSENYWAVYWDVTRQVKTRFDAAGIKIPFPQRDVHVYTHSATA